ncbi:MAG: V-type ATP synthase subunit I [Alistipes sp.]|nr:V-type ATP synthase subunit I [Alistipes sp.]
MSKYDFVLYAGQSDDFIERLRELGLVEITVRGWEADDSERRLVSELDARLKAVEALRQFRSGDEYSPEAGVLPQGGDVFALYTRTAQQIADLKTETARLAKLAEDWRAWGAFSPAAVEGLADAGVYLRFFTTPKSTFDKNIDEWSRHYDIEVVNDADGTVRFVAIVRSADAGISLDAMEAKLPQCDSAGAESESERLRGEIAKLNAVMSQCADSSAAIEAECAELKERLQNARIKTSAQREADGMLLVMEGWAEKESSHKVDAMLEQYPDVVYIKSDPTPEDETPVKLKNDRFSRMFELIGSIYALPKYGTMDLTPFFAPFYMLFFGICLNDAGYGLVLMIAGLVLLLKSKPGTMKNAAKLTLLCGGATVLFGGFCGSFFGVNLSEYFPGVHFYDFQNRFFSMALALGVVQILFGMILKIILITSTAGIVKALPSIGWFTVVAAACLAMGLPMMDESLAIPWFGSSSPAFYAVLGAGAAMMLLFNSKNPLLSIGSGLWDTYNNVTGILSDVLSYIRLFAIGLSGGVLALVFNSLAAGFAEGSGIVMKIIIMVPILLVGHGINLFMSAISSLVHPMRLTFVEFYKNAGFEMSNRVFDPLRKQNDK